MHSISRQAVAVRNEIRIIHRHQSAHLSATADRQEGDQRDGRLSLLDYADAKHLLTVDPIN